jgi:ABC-type methionine transport system ATPase subunit
MRALMMEPKVLLLDEVTSALDPELTKSVLDMVRTLAKDNHTMVVVTHHMSLALSIADRIIFLDNGKIVRDEPSFDFFHNQEDSRIIDFIESSSHKDATVEVYRGFDQFQAFQMGTLKRFEPGSWKNVVGSLGDRWFECMGGLYQEYEDMRIKNKIGWRMLQYSESTLDKNLRERHPALNEYKLLPKNLGNPANYYVLGNTVVIQMYSGENSEPTIIEIKNEQVAQSYQNYFDILWEQSTPLY